MAGLTALPQPGDVVGGKYLLESVVGSGEFGALFGARHRDTGRRLAIRWLFSAAPQSNELAQCPAPEVVGCFQHPMVLSPLDIGWTHNALYLVMEWLDGETLSSRLRRLRVLPLSEAARLLAPCLRGMHEAHLAGLVHGELRPGNIFICGSSEQQAQSIRVFDYSLARRGRSALLTMTTSGGEYTSYAGYAAPEQLKGLTADRRCDVYAFGAVLYRTLTGRMPFSPQCADDFARWVYAQDPTPPPSAPELTPQMYRFLMRAMAREPAERFGSCDELANALEALVRRPGFEEHTEPELRVSARESRERLARAPTMQLNSVVPQIRTIVANIDSPPPQQLGAGEAFHQQDESDAPVGRFESDESDEAYESDESDEAYESDAAYETYELDDVYDSDAAYESDEYEVDAYGSRGVYQPDRADEGAAFHQSDALQDGDEDVDAFAHAERGEYAHAGVRHAALPSGRPSSQRPPPLPHPPRAASGSDPAEVLVPHPYRRPLDRRLWLAGASFALVGVIPMLAYYVPPVERADAVSGEVVAPSPQPRDPERAETALSPSRAALAPEAAAVREAEPASPRAAAQLVDDPATLVDESDPLIAAALAAIRQESTVPVAASDGDERADVPPQRRLVPAVESGERAGARAPLADTARANAARSVRPAAMKTAPAAPPSEPAPTAPEPPAAAVQTLPADLKASVASMPSMPSGASSPPQAARSPRPTPPVPEGPKLGATPSVRAPRSVGVRTNSATPQQTPGGMSLF